MSRLALLSAERSDRTSQPAPFPQQTQLQSRPSPFQTQVPCLSQQQGPSREAGPVLGGQHSCHQEFEAPLSLEEEMVMLHYQGNLKPQTEYTISLSAAMT